MGHRSTFELTSVYPRGLRPRVLEYIEYLEGSNPFRGEFESKWYDREAHCAATSDMFPDVVFAITRESDDDDIWENTVWHGGYCIQRLTGAYGVGIARSMR